MFSVLILPILGLKDLRVDATTRLIRTTSRNPALVPASASIDVLSMRLRSIVESPITKQAYRRSRSRFLNHWKTPSSSLRNVSGVARLRPLALYFR